jgi:hypothetical protein
MQTAGGAMRLKHAWLCSLAILGGCNKGPTDDGTLSDTPVSELSVSERRERFSDRQDEKVGYENPSTGYTASYDLDVEYTLDGEVERINFPNGGYEDDFIDQTKNGDGTITVTDEDGREFTVPSMDDPDEDVVGTGEDPEESSDGDFE